MKSTTDTREPSTPSSTPSGVTQIACACGKVITIAGSQDAEAIAELLESYGWEFRGAWVCPKCRDAKPPMSAYDALTPFEKTVLDLLNALVHNTAQGPMNGCYVDEDMEAHVNAYDVPKRECVA